MARLQCLASVDFRKPGDLGVTLAKKVCKFFAIQSDHRGQQAIGQAIFRRAIHVVLIEPRDNLVGRIEEFVGDPPVGDEPGQGNPLLVDRESGDMDHVRWRVLALCGGGKRLTTIRHLRAMEEQVKMSVLCTVAVVRSMDMVIPSGPGPWIACILIRVMLPELRLPLR